MIKINMPRNHLLSLFLIIIAGTILRNLYLPQNLLFSFEQGRDFAIARDIASLKKFTLLGPKTDLTGIYHGVYYYYYLALVFLLTAGNPHAAAIIFTMMNAGVIIIAYLITNEFVNKKIYGLVSAGLAAISFEVLIYGRWLSNVSPSIFVFALFLYFLTKLIKTRREKFYLPVFFLWGLLLHFEILNFLTAGFLIFVLFFSCKLRPPLKIFFVSLLLLATNLLPFIVFDIKHDFLQLNGIMNYFSHPAAGFTVTSNFKNFFLGLNHEVAMTIFPFAAVFTFGFYALMILFVVRWRKQSHAERRNFLILFSFFISAVPLIIFLKFASLEQFFAGTNFAIIIFFVFLLEKSEFIMLKFKTAAALLAAVYLAANLCYVVLHLRSGQYVFYHMPYKEITYGRQLKIFDKIFAAGAAFNFDVFTTPLYRREGWQYLYEWYGAKKYAHLYAKNQQQAKKRNLYLIIEPFTSKFWRTKWLEEYNRTTVLEKEFYVNSLQIQKRRYLNY